MIRLKIIWVRLTTLEMFGGMVTSLSWSLEVDQSLLGDVSSQGGSPHHCTYNQVESGGPNQ